MLGVELHEVAVPVIACAKVRHLVLLTLWPWSLIFIV